MRIYFLLIFLFLACFATCKGEDFYGVWTNDLYQVVAAKGKNLKIGLISANRYEQGNLKAWMTNAKEEHSGNRTYYTGTLFDIDTVLTLSRVGKVASAITTTELITRYDVDIILFFGTAGAMDENVKRGDVILGQTLLQHDVDASPFVPPFTIPMIKVREFLPDPHLIELARNASQKFLSTNVLEKFSFTHPKIFEGLIASGDVFVSRNEMKQELKNKLPKLLCVEMEGAAVAQVAYEYNVPCLVIRIASDTANGDAHQNFIEFCETIAPLYAQNIVKNLYTLIKEI